MDLRQCIGQSLCVGLQTTVLDAETRRLIEKYKIGNIILFTRNIESCQQMKLLTTQIQEWVYACTGAPALIAIDQEGGVVQRLPEEVVSIPGAMAASAAGNPEDVYQLGLLTGAQLRALGANFNLAPCLDVNSNPENTVIEVRSYGQDPRQVADFGIAMANGLLEGGVIPCVKHFPGHGDTAVDSHVGLPVVKKTDAELAEMELIPFQRAIDQKLPCVMTSHILFPEIDNSGMPATLSHAILTGLLRKKMGFEGMIITDCLEMQAISAHFGTVKAAALALAAGADLLCICHTHALVEEAVREILLAVEKGDLPESRIREAAERVLRVKSLLNRPGKPPQEELLGKLAKKIRENSLTLYQNNIHAPDSNTLFMGPLAHRTTMASDAADASVSFPREMAALFNAEYQMTSINPDDEEMNNCVSRARKRSVVFGLYNGLFNEGQLRLCRALVQSGCSLTAVALRNPYDLLHLPKEATAIAAYEYTHEVFAALARLLRGEISPNGRINFKPRG